MLFKVTLENETSGVLDERRVRVEDGENEEIPLREAVLSLAMDTPLADGDIIRVRRV